ncbi:MAG: hypothetical protein L6367_00245 [Cellulomonas sp.]|nr:hypothetical protein [Cellulomonas sp.]
MTEIAAHEPASAAIAATIRPPAWWAADRRGLQSAGIGLLAAASVVAVGADAGGWQLLLRLLGTLALAGLLVRGLTGAGVRLVARPSGPGARPRVTTSLLAVPIALLLALASRLVGVEPGLAFVSALTCTIAASGQRSRAVVVVLVRSGVALVVAVLGWLGYSTLVHHRIGAFVQWDAVLPGRRLEVAEAADLATLIGAETLAAISVVAATGALVWLLPAFDGGVLWRLGPGVWAGAYTAAAVLALLVLVPPGAGWGARGVLVGALVGVGLTAGALRPHPTQPADRPARALSGSAPAEQDPGLRHQHDRARDQDS